MLKCKQSQIPQFFLNSRANNSGCSDSICPIFEVILDFMRIYVVAKSGTDWSIFADARV